MPILADVVATVEGWYDPAWAESWDAVGLVCGDPAVDVRRIVLAIDAVPSTVDSADGAQLLITHHPLLLTAVHGVPMSDPKGALVHRMIRSGVAHFVAHSNAEIGPHGVSDALAASLGLSDVEPIEAVEAPGAVGVGRVGDLAEQTTLARFAAVVAEALPATVSGLRVSGDPDARVRRVAVLGGSGSSLVEPARRAGADVFVTADLKHHHALEAVTQRRPAEASGLVSGTAAPVAPATAAPSAAAGAASKAAPSLAAGVQPMALIDVSHWASEVPWLHLLARRLRAEFGDTVEVTVSDVVTDPWSVHLASTAARATTPTPSATATSQRHPLV